MRNPRPKKFTLEQEKAMELAERLSCRAMIYRFGVAEALKTGYPGPFDIEITLQVLQDAANDEAEARRLHAKANKWPIGKAKR